MRLSASNYVSVARVTQTYDAGACVYFYFGFNYRGVANPVELYDKIEVSGLSNSPARRSDLLFDLIHFCQFLPLCHAAVLPLC